MSWGDKGYILGYVTPLDHQSRHWSQDSIKFLGYKGLRIASIFRISHCKEEGVDDSSNLQECLHLWVKLPFNVVHVLEQRSGKSLLIISKNTIVLIGFFSAPQYLHLGVWSELISPNILINISWWFFFLWSKASGVVWLLLLLPASAKTVKVNSWRLLKLFFALILCASKPSEQEWLLCLVSHHQAYGGWYEEYSQHAYEVFW